MKQSLDTTAKKPVSKRKKLVLWIGGSVVGLFVVLLVIGGIASAVDPEGMEKIRVEQAAERDAKAEEKASAERTKADEEAAAASQEAAQVEADTKANAEQEAKDAEASKKAEADKVTAQKEDAAKAKQEEEAAGKAAAQKDADAKKRASTPEGIVETSGVNDLNVHKEGTVLFAEFPISDNLTKGMIATGAQTDTLDILKAVRESGAKYTRVFVQGTFPSSDVYGNDSTATFLNAGYDKSTVDKINFDGINYERIWDLKDAGMVHADLQK